MSPRRCNRGGGGGDGRSRRGARGHRSDYSLQKLDDSCPARDNYVRCINVWCTYHTTACIGIITGAVNVQYTRVVCVAGVVGGRRLIPLEEGGHGFPPSTFRIVYSNRIGI